MRGEMPKPLAPWKIQMQHIAMWSLFGVFVVIGILSTGVALWFMTDPQGMIAEYRNTNGLEWLLDYLPLFWLVLSLLMGCAAVLIFAYVPYGYRYRHAGVIGTLILGFVAFGGAISATGFSERVELAAHYVPGYNFVQRTRMQRFMHPELGRMAGFVISIDGEQAVLRDMAGKMWTIDFSHSINPDVAEMLMPDVCIYIIGMPSSTENVFDVQDIKSCPRGLRFTKQMLRSKLKLLNIPMIAP